MKNNKIYQELTHLRKYSFAKGHSIAYGQMVWALAYHKARRPKEFWEATLKHNQSSYKKWVHKREAINNGVNLKNIQRGTIYDQFTKTGWWDGNQFLPKMGTKTEDGKVESSTDDIEGGQSDSDSQSTLQEVKSISVISGSGSGSGKGSMKSFGNQMKKIHTTG